jgi:hypothetical protein
LSETATSASTIQSEIQSREIGAPLLMIAHTSATASAAMAAAAAIVLGLMLLTGVTFYSLVLFLHVTAVVIAFGVIFSYPIFWRVAARADRRSLPYLLRTQSRVGKAVIFPGTLLVLVAGIYLVADNPVVDFGDSWVGVGLLVTLFLALVGPLYFSPTEARLAELAERDIAAAGASSS